MLFSSAPSAGVIEQIRQVPGLVARLKTLQSVRGPRGCICDLPLLLGDDTAHKATLPSDRHSLSACTMLRRSLLQVSLEYTVVDRCAFTTSQERSLQALYGEGPDQEATYDQQLRTSSTRLITLLAALKVSRLHTADRVTLLGCFKCALQLRLTSVRCSDSCLNKAMRQAQNRCLPKAASAHRRVQTYGTGPWLRSRAHQRWRRERWWPSAWQ